MTSFGVSRRGALTGAAGVGLGLPLLAACGSSESEGSTAPDPAPTASTSSSSAAPSTALSSEAPAATGLVATADVPVGGGVVLAEQQVVVTQPTAGEFKCFTAVCTHTGCLVGSVSTTIDCPCHGSAFNISTGAVEGGPAPAPLAAVPIIVKGTEIDLS